MGTSEPTGRDLVPGFAAAVTAAREAAGLSRVELADRAGVSFNTVYAIEAERRAPSLRVAAALARVVGLRAWLHDPAVPVGSGGELPQAGGEGGAAAAPASLEAARPRGKKR